MAKKMKHTSAHPGLEALAEQRAEQEPGYSVAGMRAAIASSTRNASAGAKRKNPRLLRVKG